MKKLSLTLTTSPRRIWGLPPPTSNLARGQSNAVKNAKYRRTNSLGRLAVLKRPPYRAENTFSRAIMAALFPRLPWSFSAARNYITFWWLILLCYVRRAGVFTRPKSSVGSFGHLLLNSIQRRTEQELVNSAAESNVNCGETFPVSPRTWRTCRQFGLQIVKHS